ncbi:MAG: fructose bisphosphate aldolase [Saccharospirillaceae bacterium]|nr:fructose bisphosphate aldolase [Saccharospirillaceae bacterium]
MASSAQQAMLEKVIRQNGFVAALDQSGGSTPKALKLYGVEESEYDGDEAMFAKVHEMRTRIITDPAFDGQRVLGAILFENTLDRDIEGKSSAHYLWQVKQVVPFLKVDKGLADEADGVQLMKLMPELDQLLAKANTQDVFGTKTRSVIKHANAEGVKAVVAQQFEVAKQITAAGLVPIIEPEVDINCPEKAEAEALLKQALLDNLQQLNADQKVMLKVTLPEQPNFYNECIEQANVIKVVALSGGYSRDESNTRLSNNSGMIASFSRALTQGLSAQQNDADFNNTLNKTIESIYQASIAG